jgi:hypothetical protein
VVPLFLVGVWGLWLVRDLHYLPRFPLKFAGLVAILLGPLLAAWYLLLDHYLVALVLCVNAFVTAVVGVPIETVRLGAAGLLRHLDLGLAGGGFRLEIAAQTLNLVPFVALTLASPIALGRRLVLALSGVVLLFLVHGAATSTLIVLGWGAPRLVPPFEVANDFLALAAGPGLWVLLARPSGAWFSSGAARRGGAAARQMPRSARNLA